MTRKEALEYVNNMWMYEDTKNALETLIPEFGKTGVIDHEDKYKEALLEARAVLEPCLKYSRGKVREALDSIDKELKRFESEDERIIDDAIQIIRASRLRCAEYGSEADKHLKAIAWLEKQKEQKPDWSEEDKKFIKHCAELLDGQGQPMCALRLESLCPQKLDASKLENFDPVDVLNRIKTEWPMALEKVVGKQEWSEEDEKMAKTIISVLERSSQVITYEQRGGLMSGSVGCSDKYKEEIAWLKSLRPQYHGDVTMTEAYKMGLEAGKASSWKPSEEQMSYLLSLHQGGEEQKPLRELIEQLKKL